MSRITITELAKALGVSKATVSRALNDSAEVSAATRRRVLEMADALGFASNSGARSLAGAPTGCIGLAIPRAAAFIYQNPYFGGLMEGIGAAVETAAYHVIVETRPDPLAFLKLVRERRVDGLLLTGNCVTDESRHVIGSLIESGFPVVLVNCRTHRLRCPSVSVDEESGVFQAVGHLVSGGHERIGFIASPPDTAHGRARKEAFLAALLEYHVPSDPGLMETGADTSDSGANAAARLLARGRPFSALVCSNDMMACGAIATLHEQGLRVPEDVAVVGFDDIPLASVIRPKLTTVRQPVARVGHVATGLLLDQVQKKDSAIGDDQVRLTTEFVPRESA